MIRIIIGLGNPGSKYALTRHNVGFTVVDRLAKKLSVKVNEPLCHSLISLATYQGEYLILAKPQTYMNDSGRAIKALLEWYEILPEEILVVYDDVELDFGKLRIRKRGNHGGHNGVKSIISQIATVEFPRLRVGIGGAPEGDDLVEYVLSEFEPHEEEIMAEVEERAAEAIICLLTEGIDTAMNKFN